MKSKLSLGLAALLVAGLNAGTALASPLNLTLQKFIPIPVTKANNQGGRFTGFDISFFDPATQNVYIADRSNAAVDIISGNSLSVIGQATGFVGQKSSTSISGPDGVLTVTNAGVTTLYAGDGNSTLKVFDVTSPAAPTLLQTISTNGSSRVDEMAYSPSKKQLLVANNADAPAFGTLFNTTPTASIASGKISISGAHNDDGLEQPVWNPNTKSFFISVPAFQGDAGGVAEINTDGTVGRLYKFADFNIKACSPTGLALGASGNLLVGCANKTSQTVLLDPTGAGTIVKTFSQIAGSDEIWYDPASGNFYVTGADSSGNRVFDVINDASQTVLQSVVLPVSPLSNPHSIAVDSLNGDVFVALAGTATVGVNGVPTLVVNTACDAGCIAVYGVPEPASLPLLLAGVGALLGLGYTQRRGRNA